jgi:iron complex outermembrane receptor protein
MMFGNSVAVSALALGLAAMPAQAQEAPAPASASDAVQGPQIEDIVVTAQKRGTQSLQKVPIAISAYSGEQLETLGIKSFNTIDLKTPGLVFTQNSGTVQPYIRGVGTEFPNVGLEPSISVYLDDVYWQRATGSNYNLIDVDQIQVLKGPQGTLYGRNATGGAILLTTRNPEFKNSAHFAFEVGNLDHQQVDAVLNAGLSDQFAVRVAARFSDQDGYIHNPATGEDFAGYRNYEVRGKALYQSGDFSALLTLGYNRSSNRSGLRQQVLDAPLCLVCAITGATPPPGKYQTYQGVPPTPIRSHVYYGTLKLEGKLGDLTLTSISSLRKASAIAATDEVNFAGAPLPVRLDLLTFNVPQNDGKDALQEFRLASDFDSPLNFLLGVNGQHTKETFATLLTGAAFAGSFQSSLDKLKTDSASVYAELYYDLSDTLKLTVGGRLNYDKKVGNSQPGGVAAQPAYTYRYSSTKFTPRAVLAWSPDSDQNYYLSFGSGVKSGGFNYPSFANSPTDILKPERLNSYEVGAKNSFLDNRVRTTLAVFYYNYSNMQVAFADATRGSVRVNAGKSEGYGAEFDAQIAVSSALTLGLGYSYLHARFTDYPNATLYQAGPVGVPGVIGLIIPNLKGSPLTRAPDHTAYANATYSFDLPSDWGGSVSAVGRYTSSYDFNPGRGGALGLDYQKSFTLVNLSSSFGPKDGNFKIGLFVNNLFDKYYLQNLATNNFGAYRGAAPPRTYGGSVSVDF